LNRFVQAPDPIKLSYTINVDKEYSLSPKAYDIEVEFEDVNMKSKMAHLMNGGNADVTGKIQSLDEQVPI
jgi:hypothetical protein